MAQEVKIELALDTSKFDRQLGSAIRNTGKLENELDNISEVKVDIAVDTSQVDKASSEIQSINGETASVDVQVDVDQTEVDSLWDKLKTPVLITLGVATGAVAAGAGVLLNEIQSDTEAVRTFTTATDTAAAPVEEIGGIIGDVWNTGLAESKVQIAGITAELYRAGVPIADLGKTAQDALAIAAQSGEEVGSIIQAQIKLVNTGLATSYQEASDIISGGFAQGLNRSGDFLDTIKEYSKDFADLGVTGETFFNILKSGLEGGAYNTDKIADAFRELKIRVATALSTGEGTEFDALKNLGLLDEARARDAGTITGEAFVTAALAAFQTGGLGDLVGVFGSPTEDLGTAVFNSINDALGNPDLLNTWAGTTDRMAAGLEDTLGFALNRAKNVVVSELAEGFVVAGKPLTDLLDSLPDKLNSFSELVASGVGIPETLEMVLSAPGLAEEIRNLQGAIGGFIVDFQLGLASVLSAFGQGDAAQSLTGSARAGGEQQLIFDLQFSNDTQDIDQAFKDAARRGVSDGFREQAVSEATAAIADELGTKAASSFVTNLEELQTGGFATAIIDDVRFSFLQAQSEPIQIPIELMTGETPAEAFARLYPAGENGGLNPNLLALATASGLDTTMGALTPLSTTFVDTELDTALIDAANAALEATMPLETLGIRTAGADDALINYGTTVDNSIGKFDAFGNAITTNAGIGADAIDNFGARVTMTLAQVDAAAMLTQQHLFDAGVDPTRFAALAFGTSVNANGQSSAQYFPDGSHASGLGYVPFDNYLGNLHKGEMVLNAGAAAQYRAGGGASNINTVNINVVQNLNSSGMAQSTAAGSIFANRIRGY